MSGMSQGADRSGSGAAEPDWTATANFEPSPHDGSKPLPAFGMAEPGSPLARLDQRWQDERDHRERQKQIRAQERSAEAEVMLRRFNRGEPFEVAADLARESTEIGPLSDASDAELDECTIEGIVEAKRRGLLPARFYQSRADFDAEVAAMKAETWRQLRCVTRRAPALATRPVGARRARGRREHRPGTRKAASGSRAGPGGPDPDEPDAELAARLSIAVSRLIRRCELRMLAAPSTGQADRFMRAGAPSASSHTRAAALDRLAASDRAAIARANQAEYRCTEGGRP